MQVHVVVSQTLLGGQARAEPAMRGFGYTVLIDAERRQDLPQPLDLILIRARDVFESPSRRRTLRSRETRAHRRGFGCQVLSQKTQAAPPLGQRLARLGKQPRYFADDREPAAAGAAHPARARQRDRAAMAARTGKHARQWVGFRQSAAMLGASGPFGQMSDIRGV